MLGHDSICIYVQILENEVGVGGGKSQAFFMVQYYT